MPPKFASTLAALAALLLSVLGPAHAWAPFEVSRKAPSPAAPERQDAALKPQFVREAQRTLRDLGYHPGPIDGTIGPRTRIALSRYQRDEHLLVTGWLDSETVARLDIHERVLRAARPPVAEGSAQRPGP